MSDYLLNNKYILTKKLSENSKCIVYKGCERNKEAFTKYIITCLKIPKIHWEIAKKEVLLFI